MHFLSLLESSSIKLLSISELIGTSGAGCCTTLAGCCAILAGCCETITGCCTTFTGGSTAWFATGIQTTCC